LPVRSLPSGLFSFLPEEKDGWCRNYHSLLPVLTVRTGGIFPSGEETHPRVGPPLSYVRALRPESLPLFPRLPKEDSPLSVLFLFTLTLTIFPPSPHGFFLVTLRKRLSFSLSPFPLFFSIFLHPPLPKPALLIRS